MNLPLHSTPDTSAPHPVSFGMNVLYMLRESGARWPSACRAALSLGLPVAAGWIAGDISAGLIATIGAFTALYAADRPYRNRARLLAGIALSFSAVVSLGAWAQATGLLQWYPPSSSSRWRRPSSAIRSGSGRRARICSRLPVPLAPPCQPPLTLSACSCSAAASCRGSCTCAARSSRRAAPNKRRLPLAARAVAQFAQATGTLAQDPARHDAALALHHAWTTLVTFQPATPRTDNALSPFARTQSRTAPDFCRVRRHRRFDGRRSDRTSRARARDRRRGDLQRQQSAHPPRTARQSRLGVCQRRSRCERI